MKKFNMVFRDGITNLSKYLLVVVQSSYFMNKHPTYFSVSFMYFRFARSVFCMYINDLIKTIVFIQIQKYDIARKGEKLFPF